MTRPRPIPTRLPVALTIAGSDSGGGAGIQADLKTFEALGVFGTSALTAVTAQNTQTVSDVHEIPPETVRAQIDAVVADLQPGAVKTGMLSSQPIIEVVADALESLDVPVVVDPVMVAKSGHALLRAEAQDAMRDRIVPHASLLTPNIPEAEVLTSRTIRSPDDMTEALDDLRALGPAAVLLKGGHLDDDTVLDLLYDGTTTLRLEKSRIDTQDTHGTGCTLAAGIAAGLATGLSVEEAVRQADRLLQRGIRHALRLGGGHGPVHHMAWLRNEASRARVLDELDAATRRFVDANPTRILPEIGTNIAATTAYPTDLEDVAGIRGRVVRVRDGDGRGTARAAGAPGFGASRHVASLLLAVRAHDPTVGAAINLRHDEDIDQAVQEMGWDVVRFDRAEEPEDVKRREGGTLPWAGHRVMRGRTRAPRAVVDSGEVGKEAILRLLGEDAADVVAAALTLASALEEHRPAASAAAPDPTA